MDSSALSRCFAVLGNLVQSGAGVAPVLAEGCCLGKRRAPRIALFDHIVRGQQGLLKVMDLGCFFFFSFYFSLPRPQQSQEVGELLADDQIWLFTSLSMDFPSAKVSQVSQVRSLSFASSLVHTEPTLAHE